MSTPALEAIGKVFTGEVMDILLKEGLLDYYDMVSSFEDKGYNDDLEDVKHNRKVCNALAIVLEDFMTEGEYKFWLQERRV